MIEKEQTQNELDTRKRYIERKQKLAQEYENKKSEKQKLEAYLRQLPEGADDQSVLEEISKLNAELSELKKRKALKEEEYEYRDKLAQDQRTKGREIRQLEIENKHRPRMKLEEFNDTYAGLAKQGQILETLRRQKSDREDDENYQRTLWQQKKELERKSQVAEAEMAQYPDLDEERQRLINETEGMKHKFALQEEHKKVKELNYKSEKANRELEAYATAQQRADVLALENQIAKQTEDLARKEEHNKQLQKLAETNRATREIEAANSAKAASGYGFDKLLEKSVAFNEKINEQLERKGNRIDKHVDLVKGMRENADLLPAFNEWGRKTYGTWKDYDTVEEVAGDKNLYDEDGEIAIDDFHAYWNELTAAKSKAEAKEDDDFFS